MDPKKRIGTRRPVYRDSNEEKAVKVFTINQESRYILVKGIPKISNITEEVMKLFSLYGAIQEYRILDDYPDAEDFTAVYWIKYVDIQAARVAKQKMNKQSFYGGVLKVCYGPEYEDVEDTRQKLIGRRKSVAWRLRHLGRNKETKDLQSVSHVSSPEIKSASNNSPQSEKRSNHFDSPADKPAETQSSGSLPLFPMLPPPPLHLPPAEWNSPPKVADSTLPHASSAHETLPRCSPFQNKESSVCDSTTGSDTFGHNYKRTIREREARNETYDKETSLFFQPWKVPKKDTPASSPWAFSGRRHESSDQVSKGSLTDQCKLRRGPPAKDVPRKRFAWSSENCSERQQFLGQRMNPPPLPARNHSSEVRSATEAAETVRWGTTHQLKTGVKRQYSPLNEADASSYDSSGPSSFDKSMLTIRAKLREASGPSRTAQIHQNVSSQPHLRRQTESHGVNESLSLSRISSPSAAASHQSAGTSTSQGIPSSISLPPSQSSRSNTATAAPTSQQNQRCRPSASTRRRI